MKKSTKIIIAVLAVAVVGVGAVLLNGDYLKGFLRLERAEEPIGAQEAPQDVKEKLQKTTSIPTEPVQGVCPLSESASPLYANNTVTSSDKSMFQSDEFDSVLEYIQTELEKNNGKLACPLRFRLYSSPDAMDQFLETFICRDDELVFLESGDEFICSKYMQNNDVVANLHIWQHDNSAMGNFTLNYNDDNKNDDYKYDVKTSVHSERIRIDRIPVNW
ncbi:hypothetical protein GF366_00100 [Candidatus Peregrinibacteria bacterium]|nr:hypothetical protein [Candidatus Peregrinibacteria bacterium]